MNKIKSPKRMAAGVILILTAVILRDQWEVSQGLLVTGVGIIVSGLLAKDKKCKKDNKTKGEGKK
jgi:hypothetical protein